MSELPRQRQDFATEYRAGDQTDVPLLMKVSGLLEMTFRQDFRATAFASPEIRTA